MTCACGCGKETRLATRTNKRLGYETGKPYRYLPGHVHAKGPRSFKWKGGKVRTAAGYVLSFVGIGHPMADKRGYAYEHRIVANPSNQQVVHHRNGKKDDNSPENLEITTQEHHAATHLTRSEASRRGKLGNAARWQRRLILDLAKAGRLEG
jgi:hypothetical protein